MKSAARFSLAMLLAVAAPLGATSPELFILEQEGRRLLQARFLARGPVGAAATITVRNPGDPTPRTGTFSRTARATCVLA